MSTHLARALGYLIVLMVFLPVVGLAVAFGPRRDATAYFHSDFAWIWFLVAAALLALMFWVLGRIRATRDLSSSSASRR
jgi:uncharacterized membrane protein